MRWCGWAFRSAQLLRRVSRRSWRYTAPMADKARQTAPAFELQSTKGELVSSADFAGQLAVLYFHAPENSPTTQLFVKSLSALRRIDLKVYAISIPPPPVRRRVIDARDFRQQFPANVMQLIDPDHRTIEAYGAWGLLRIYSVVKPGIVPTIVLVDADGTISKRWPAKYSHLEAMVSTVKRLASRLEKKSAPD